MGARNAIRRSLTISLGALCASALLAGSGCAVSANYPPRGESDLAVNDPNVHPTPKLVELALDRVTERTPVEGAYAANLPQGMEKRWAELMLHRMADARAQLVRPDNEDLPTFHVTRVWVRPGRWGEVEILRPVASVAGPGGGNVYQPVTVRLRKSGLGKWRVEATRIWPIREVPEPVRFGWAEDAHQPALPDPAPGAPDTELTEVEQKH